MESTEDVNDLCRICGLYTSGLERHSIFEESGLHNQISSCLPISVSAKDDLPKFICGECEYKLKSLHAFRENSVKTQKHLKSLVSNKKKIGKLCTHDRGEVCHDPLSSADVSDSKCSEKNVGESPLQSIKSEDSTSEQNKSEIPSNASKRPIRAVRLNNEVSYNCDSILESLLENGPSSSTSYRPNKILQKGPILKECKICAVHLPPREYQLHFIKEHKDERQYECQSCKVQFSSLTDLQLHYESEGHIFHENTKSVEEKKAKIFQCIECKKLYTRRHLLVLHMRRHTGEQPFHCHLCDKKYSCKGTLKSHLLKHKEEWKHVCNFCGKGFVDKYSFIYHIRSNHTGERPFPCTSCDKKFIKKQDLMKHEQSQHSTSPTDFFACETCNRVCKDYDSLRSHRRSHIPVEVRRVHKCTVCEASFTGKTGLAKHMHRHTGEMPYECEQCAKRFFTKKGLQLHLVIHSGVKSFICEICGRAFSQDNTLRVHRRTHTGERPYECNVCAKRFTQSSALNSHKKLHLKDSDKKRHINSALGP